MFYLCCILSYEFFILHDLPIFSIYTFLIVHFRNFKHLKNLLENILRVRPWWMLRSIVVNCWEACAFDQHTTEFEYDTGLLICHLLFRSNKRNLLLYVAPKEWLAVAWRHNQKSWYPIWRLCIKSEIFLWSFLELPCSSNLSPLGSGHIACMKRTNCRAYSR